MRRRLPTPDETLRILGEKRTRPQRRAPPRAGKPLGALLKELEGRFGQTETALQSRWSEIVGETLARYSEPIKLIKGRAAGAGGTLQLKVDGPVAALVQHQAPDILARANLVLGAGSVDKLRIVQGPVKPRPQASDPAARVRERRRRVKPLDAADEARLEAGLSEAPDGRLKSALKALGREVMRRDGGD